jgi:hypothetical protein
VRLKTNQASQTKIGPSWLDDVTDARNLKGIWSYLYSHHTFDCYVVQEEKHCCSGKAFISYHDTGRALCRILAYPNKG